MKSTKTRADVSADGRGQGQEARLTELRGDRQSNHEFATVTVAYLE
jgi:hypothetical protein